VIVEVDTLRILHRDLFLILIPFAAEEKTKPQFMHLMLCYFILKVKSALGKDIVALLFKEKVSTTASVGMSILPHAISSLIHIS
jgi:hypothetical protein